MRPRWVLNPEEVAIIDTNAESLGIDKDELMKRAATELHVALLNAPKPIWILCGPGNNGGDGFRLAMMLEHCEIISTHSSQKTKLSQRARDDCTKKIRYISNLPSEEPAVIVDCLLGAGAKGQPRGSILELMEAIPGNPMILACDLPTGCGSGLSFNAFRTVTFIAPKSNMVDENKKLLPEVGDLFIAGLELPDEIFDPGPGDLLRYPSPQLDAIKGDRGRVLIVGGGPYHGAPLLAAMAAQRVGIDLVHVAMPVQAASKAAWPPGLIPEPISDKEILTDVTNLIKRCKSGRGVQALVIGPGLGKDKQTLAAVQRLVKECSSIPTVIDADAISAFEKWPEGMIGVFTPHKGELENWIGGLEVIPEILEGYGEQRIVVQTGPEDIIIGASGRGGVVSGGNPRMAMGGTGDLLAGTIGGLMALGITPWGASRLGTWLMRRAGMLAGDEIGPGIISEDIPRFISEILKHC